MRSKVSRTLVVKGDEFVSVPDADEMETDIFCLHMTHRHLDSLGGLTFLSPFIDEYIEECYRIFHDRLHKVRIDLNHEHEMD